MHKRLLILTAIVLAALIALSCLGHHAVTKWAQGLEGARLGEFAEVAEQIRQDVKRKLDEFMRIEQERPYTDYLYSYVPDNVVTSQQTAPVLRSPLAGVMTNSIAYGYFQVEPDNTIVNPYYRVSEIEQADSGQLAQDVQSHLANVRDNVVPMIEAQRELLAKASSLQDEQQEGALVRRAGGELAKERANTKSRSPKVAPQRSKAYPIESLRQQTQRSQVVTQDRDLVAMNWIDPSPGQQAAGARGRGAQTETTDAEQVLSEALREQSQSLSDLAQAESQIQVVTAPMEEEETAPAAESDQVQIRIEPFVPVVVPTGPDEISMFGGQVFLLRYVQIEQRNLIQGFQLDEAELVREVEESAQRLMRDGMAFELPAADAAGKGLDENGQTTAYTAFLDFGFGDLALNLKEMDPGWITKRIGELEHVYLGIVLVVAVAVALALTSLWRTTRQQLALAKKKDEFISAVSHELRTPLTSIRMYAEMLEKNWLSSQDKATEYYRNIRQESERLSRLIDNVLDFSRLQRGRKRYDFRLGDVNACIADVVTMMSPYAAEHGFTIETHPGELGQVAFDRDAVAQIAVNLLDNAVKYAKSAQDKTIVVRTRASDGYAIIEVEDHGPGVAHRQRKRVFEQFYRGAPTEGDRGAQATGTGLGLALVQRFAQAHDGFVEILSADPCGALFRVGLTLHG